MPGRGAADGYGDEPTEFVAGGHTLIVGTNGSGKSVLAGAIARQAVSDGWPLVIFDAKHEVQYPGALEVSSWRDIEADATRRRLPISPPAGLDVSPVIRAGRAVWSWLTEQPLAVHPQVSAEEIQTNSEGDGAPVYLYRPDRFALGDPEAHNDLWWYVHQRKRTLVWIDEAYMVARGGSHEACPSGLIACITQGRSREVSLLICSQRPRNIPHVLITEPQRVAAFHLAGEDRDTLAKSIREEFAIGPQEWCKRLNVADTTGYEFLWYSRKPGNIPEIRRLPEVRL